MADKPIIFSAPMVRALLEGRKTQTRRVLKGKSGVLAARSVLQLGAHWLGIEYDRSWPLRLPYSPGDRLWVKERAAWVSAKGWRYMADNDDLTEEYEMGEVGKWCSPIFMRRRASRLTLTVTDVRVQRLQEISEADAVAEGIEDGGCTECGGSSRASEGCCYDPSPDFRDSFAFLWNSLHGPDAWDANPWVMALTFKVHRGNIDAMEASK